MADLPIVAIRIKDGKIQTVKSDTKLWYVIINDDHKDFNIFAIEEPDKSVGEILFEGVEFFSSS